jgi:hypothetical protein
MLHHGLDRVDDVLAAKDVTIAVNEACNCNEGLVYSLEALDRLLQSFVTAGQSIQQCCNSFCKKVQLCRGHCQDAAS